MKTYILLIVILFASILSYAQHDCLKATLGRFSTGPSYLVVKVKSPSYEGEAIIFNDNFFQYYEIIKEKSLTLEEYIEFAYQDIKQGKYFIVSDEDFIRKFGVPQPYLFEKIILSDRVLNNAKKGIEFFIRTYFDEEGEFNPPPSYEPSDYETIVKVMFDAGIQTAIDCEWSGFYIQDKRFYVWNNEEWKFIIPPEYRDSEK